MTMALFEMTLDSNNIAKARKEDVHIEYQTFDEHITDDMKPAKEVVKNNLNRALRGITKMEETSLQLRLLNVQSKLKAPKIRYNEFGDFYSRSCEDILEAAKPLLDENNLLMTISDSIELIGDRYYIKSTATVRSGDESISTCAYAREDVSKKKMDLSQLTGSCSSYARKYALNAMFLIDDTKDADTMDNSSKGSSKAPSEPITDNQKKIIYAIGMKMGVSKEDIIKTQNMLNKQTASKWIEDKNKEQNK